MDAEAALRGIHILLVVQDPDSRRLITTVLEYAGALVSAVASAHGALAELETIGPDVLVADFGSDNDGAMGFVERVRALPRNAEVPALILRERGGRDPRELLKAGFHYDLVKPIDPWDLCRVVAVLAGRR